MLDISPLEAQYPVFLNFTNGIWAYYSQVIDAIQIKENKILNQF